MSRYGLVADAGGTNVRFALVDLDATSGLTAPKKFTSKSFASIAQAARAYLAEQKIGAPPIAAVISVAGPVSGNAIHMTNLGWQFSGEALGAELGIAQVRLINDYEAIARAIPTLTSGDLRDIGNWNSTQKSERETIAIVGPGTGLGVGGYARSGNNFMPLVTEGGHADFAPTDDVEIEILKILRDKFGHVSNERILSGPGLVNLYDALAAIEGQQREELDPHAITSRALADRNSFCAQVLSRFCAILGSVAGDVALIMGAKQGLFLAGGILPAVADLLAESDFRARFEAKGRFEFYLKDIPTRLIVNDNAGLLGAATLVCTIVSC